MVDDAEFLIKTFFNLQTRGLLLLEMSEHLVASRENDQIHFGEGPPKSA